MIDHRRCRKAAICTAPSGRHILAKLSQSLDVGFVDDRVLPGDRRSTFFAPCERFIDDHALWYSTSVVAPVEREVGARAAGAIAKMCVAPDEAPGELPSIGIDEQLVRIEAQSPLRVIRAVNPVTVELSRRNIIEVAMPDILGTFWQRDALDLAPTMAVEWTKLDLFGIRRKQRETSSAPIPSGSRWMRRTGRNPHTTAPEREKLPQGAEQQDLPRELCPRATS